MARGRKSPAPWTERCGSVSRGGQNGLSSRRIHRARPAPALSSSSAAWASFRRQARGGELERLVQGPVSLARRRRPPAVMVPSSSTNIVRVARAEAARPAAPSRRLVRSGRRAGATPLAGRRPCCRVRANPLVGFAANRGGAHAGGPRRVAVSPSRNGPKVRPAGNHAVPGRACRSTPARSGRYHTFRCMTPHESVYRDGRAIGPPA